MARSICGVFSRAGISAERTERVTEEKHGTTNYNYLVQIVGFGIKR